MSILSAFPMIGSGLGPGGKFLYLSSFVLLYTRAKMRITATDRRIVIGSVGNIVL